MGHTGRKRKKGYFTENYKFNFQIDLDCRGPRALINDRHLSEPPPFSLYTTFDVSFYCMVNCGFALLPSSGSSQPCVHSQCASRKVSTSPCAHPISRSFLLHSVACPISLIETLWIKEEATVFPLLLPSYLVSNIPSPHSYSVRLAHYLCALLFFFSLCRGWSQIRRHKKNWGASLPKYSLLCAIQTLFSIFLSSDVEILTLIRMTKDEKGLAFFKGLLL